MIPNPPLDAFLASFPEEREWGQLWIRREDATSAATEGGFELRHGVDRAAAPDQLKVLEYRELRGLAQSTPDGRYRPWSGAPNLASGWRCRVRDGRELGEAIQRVYPGSLADAWAAGRPGFVAEDFGAVAARQPGRTKILATLSGAALGAVVEAGCGVGSCVKRRLWGCGGSTSGDDAARKSAIPCLEPCPFFVGFARTCAEIEQRVRVPVELAPDDLATLAAALRHALEHPPRGLREGDVADPLHPWRVSRLLGRYEVLGSVSTHHSSTSDE
ncbi:MAG: hypothetical protein JNL97_09220 [Verrucomicrobiales bacterium]|nr:hypothetical protein [Verrucomicrobiales bacterium]